MKEFWPSGAVFDTLIDVLVEEVLIEQSLGNFLKQLHTKLHALFAQVNLFDEKRQARVEAWVDVD